MFGDDIVATLGPSFYGDCVATQLLQLRMADIPTVSHVAVSFCLIWVVSMGNLMNSLKLFLQHTRIVGCCPHFYAQRSQLWHHSQTSCWHWNQYNLSLTRLRVLVTSGYPAVWVLCSKTSDLSDLGSISCLIPWQSLPEPIQHTIIKSEILPLSTIDFGAVTVWSNLLPWKFVTASLQPL